MAKKPKETEGFDEVDNDVVVEVTDEEVAPNPFSDASHDDVEHSPMYRGALHALSGFADELHAIHIRLAEIAQFLPVAIEKSEGDVKEFLLTLKSHL